MVHDVLWRRPGRAFSGPGRIAAALVLALAASAHAGVVTVTYGAVDLPDTVAGRDLWRYDYTIGGAFAAFDTLSVEFASGLYDQLDLSTPPAVLDAQPIVAGLPGTSSLLLLTAMSATPALSDSASVSFVWLGIGQPGTQSFSVVSDAGPVVQTGATTSVVAVPEPASWALLLAALAGLSLTRPPAWRRQHR